MKIRIKLLLIFFCLNGYQNIAAMEEDQPAPETLLEKLIRERDDTPSRKLLVGIQEENMGEIETSVQLRVRELHHNPFGNQNPFEYHFAINNDTYGNALYLAIVSSKSNAVKKLLELGASPTESCCWLGTIHKPFLLNGGRSVPLTIALRQGNVNPAIVRALLEHGANPKAIGEYGKNSLEIARERGLLHLFHQSKKSAAFRKKKQ